MKTLLLTAMAVLAIWGVIPAAGKDANFSGTWVRDPARSVSRQESRDGGITSVLSGMTGGHSGGLSPEIKGGAGDQSAESAQAGMNDLKDFAGEWMERPTVTIVQNEDELQVTRQFFTADGMERPVSQRFALDGSRSINVASDCSGEFESRSTWKDGKLVNAGIQLIPVWGKKIEASVTEEYSISKDGKRLTIERKSITPQGVTKIKQVFNKQ